jgi:hypothetical protein
LILWDGGDAGKENRTATVAPVQLLLEHLPHLVPAVVGLGFLGRFTLTSARLPPSGLTDAELAEWQRERRRRGLRRLVPGR